MLPTVFLSHGSPLLAVAPGVYGEAWRDLAAWQDHAPHARRAHPTPEHLLPLLVAYGAAGEQPRVARPLANYSGRALAMDCYVFS
ncbi:MAG: hypothetical protein ACOY41_07630 [Pseudomonadota bacterium]